VIASQVQTDFALLGELVDDLRFKVGAVDAGLPEGPGEVVLLPIVVPVALLVGAVPEHGHLETGSDAMTYRKTPPDQVRLVWH